MFSAAGNKSGVNLERKNHFLRCDNISRNSLSGEIKNSWTKESNKSLSHFVDLRRGGHFTDVTLDIFGTQIKAHKVKYLSSLVGIVSQVLPTDRVICQQSIFLHAVLLPPEWEVRRDSVLWRGVSGRDEVGTSTSEPHPQYNPGWSWPRLLWACWWTTSTLGKSGWTPTSAPWWTSPSPRTVSSSRRAATCCQPRINDSCRRLLTGSTGSSSAMWATLWWWTGAMTGWRRWVWSHTSSLSGSRSGIRPGEAAVMAMWPLTAVVTTKDHY